MSVTVKQLLSLPALQEGSVLAGDGGLSRLVSCVTVLESVNPAVLIDELFVKDIHYGGELGITSFMHAATDVTLQCANIRRLNAMGVSGLALYYVGIFIPEVDAQVLDLCNQLDFPLIVMPPNRLDLRYSDLITQVMEVVISDRLENAHLLLESAQYPMQIWGQQHQAIAIQELVGAILKDDPVKMHRLAELFHIDVSSLHEMWIIHSTSPQTLLTLESLLPAIKDLLITYGHNAIADIYDGHLVIFPHQLETLGEMEETSVGILALCHQADTHLTLTRCPNLATTAHARRAFTFYQDNIKTATTLFPHRSQFLYTDLMFAHQCTKQIAQGETSIAQATWLLDCFATVKNRAELLETLTVYLLDADASIAKTGALLYVHKNTIKYRMQLITTLLGYRLSSISQLSPLHLAVGIHRLLSPHPS